MAQALTNITSRHSGDPEVSACDYAALAGRIAEAAAEAGYAGLPDICLLFQDRLLGLAGAPLSDLQCASLKAWPELVRTYLEAPGHAYASAALVEHLRDPIWDLTLSDGDVAMFKAMLLLSPTENGSGTTSAVHSGDFELTGRSSLAVDELAVPTLDSLDEDLASSGDSVAPPLATHEVPRPNDGASEHERGEADPILPIDPSNPRSPFDGDTRPGSIAGATPAIAIEQLPPALRELVEILVGELPQLEIAIDQAAGLTTADSVGDEVRTEAYDNLLTQLQRFGGASAAVGFMGLELACSRARDNIKALADNRTALDAQTANALSEWLKRLREYLACPGGADTSRALAEALSCPDLPRPGTTMQEAELAALLMAPDFSEVVAALPTRAQTASAEDVSLELPEDVNHDILDGLLQELPSQTETFSAAVQRLAHRGSLQDIEIAQRIAHTLKGAANTVGVKGIARLTHQLEDILLALSKHQTLPSRPLADTILNAADCLAAMSEYLTGSGDAPGDALTVLQEVLEWANRIDNDGVAAIRSQEPVPPDDTSLDQPALPSAADAALSGTLDDRRVDDRRQAPRRENNRGDQQNDLVPMLRVPATLVDELLRLAGESIILTGQLHERLRRTAAQTATMRSQFDLLRQLGADLEEFIDVTDLSASQQNRGRDTRFDALEMDQYSELHTYARRLVEAATDARDMGQVVSDHLAQIDDMLINQEHINRDTQDAVLRTRMVPVKTIFPRLQRGVRQTSRMTGKRAELLFSGGDTLMDNDVLNEMVDPLMHMLRNAVDHGIEEPEGRLDAGKDPQGKIWLEFLRDGNHIVVRCQDDGRGLDYEAIRRTAEGHGLVTGDRELSDEELKRFILRPNFSTRKQTTQTSGRGIGMDAVYTKVIELGGSLALQSISGRGTTFELRLPTTLISTHALLVQLGSQTVAISSRGVEQILYSDGSSIRELGTELIYQTEHSTYPVRPIESMAFLAGAGTSRQLHGRPVVLVQGEIGPTAVLVESILDTRDLVVKDLGSYIPKMRGVLGVTILGDGSVTPVLDLPELLRHTHHAGSETDDGTAGHDLPTAHKRPPLALVVDDSLSARRALAHFIADSGFDVNEARDGMEALDRITDRKPDIMLVDMEMPRMNGIELTTHVRSRAELADIPIIMVTSRSTQKHREQARAAGVNEYMTKPFSEDTLLEKVQGLIG
jgi:chemosensory pili system protein ChpA (sensor histidine kinase/response regulator)